MLGLSKHELKQEIADCRRLKECNGSKDSRQEGKGWSRSKLQMIPCWYSKPERRMWNFTKWRLGFLLLQLDHCAFIYTATMHIASVKLS